MLKRSLPYLEASLLGRLYSEMQGAHKNKALYKALEQECSDLETLIEEIRGTIRVTTKQSTEEKITRCIVPDPGRCLPESRQTQKGG